MIRALRWQLPGSFRRFSGKYYAFDLNIAILKALLSLSTIHREYAALVSLPYYDYVDMILRPQLPMPPQVDPRDIDQRTSSKRDLKLSRYVRFFVDSRVRSRWLGANFMI